MQQAPAPSKTRVATVTVGLLNGQFRGGRLAGFDPNLTDLALVAETEGGARTVRHMIAAETAAYVAFHRGAGERNEPGDGAEALVITLVGGQTFRVRASAPSRGGVGFFATPDDAASPFREFFFYNAALRVMESAEPLGEMLVDREKVSAEQVEQAVATQVEDRHRTLGEILVEQASVSPEAIAEAVALQARRRVRIGELLVEAGLVTEAEVARALDEQKRRRGRRLGEVLVAMGALSEVDLAHTLATKFHLPFEDLDLYPIDPTAATALPRAVIEKHQVLPIAIDAATLTVALSDPLAIDVIDDVMVHAQRKVREVVATPSQIQKHVRAVLASLGDADANAIDELLAANAPAPPRPAPGPAPGAPPAGPRRPQEAEAQEPDSVVVRVVNQILLDAYRRGASDIHIEPRGTEHPTHVRFRVDGDCVDYRDVPGAFGGPIVSRLKIMADLDISERRRAQDGKLKIQAHDRQVELRLVTVPTVNGNEDAVMRILADSKPMPLDGAGLSPRNLRELKALVTRPYGLLLCVGPTGSGKTTTLHAMLGFINTPDMKIWTAEDPVEITQPGLRQVQVHPKIGVTFATALRTFLRADPDVIMVGEMRDEETASMAIEASLTGHLVLSTLHTNSAPETVTRLLDMGLDPFSFADALLGVLAQRLARGLCPSCKASSPGTREAWEAHARAYGVEAFEALHPFGESFVVWRAPGCPACHDTGYKGRVALHELMVADDPLRLALTRRQGIAELRALAVAGGMTTLLQDGVEKALAGRTDLAQVLAVASR